MSLDLTPGQREVFKRLCTGYTGPQIAHNMQLSIKTIERRISDAKTRNDVSTTYTLVAIFAVEEAIKQAVAEMERRKAGA